MMNGELGGYAVAAWLTLAIGRRWRPEPSWVNRWGRAIGVFWLLMIPQYASISILASSELQVPRRT